MYKKIQLTLFLLIILSLSIFIACGDTADSDNTVKPEPEYSPIGTWRLELNPLPNDTTIDSTIITMTFTDAGDDTTFAIWVKQKISVALIDIYESGGSASMNDTAVTVVGSDCMILDSETQQMVPVDENICATPLSIPTDGLKESTWMISGTAVANLPFLSDDQKALIGGVSLPFIRIQ